MPKMTGIELLVLIKKNERLKKIPIYMLSTSCSESELEKIDSLGATMIQKQSQFSLNIQMLRSIIKPKPVVRWHFFLVDAVWHMRSIQIGWPVDINFTRDFILSVDKVHWDLGFSSCCNINLSFPRHATCTWQTGENLKQSKNFRL